MTQKIQITVKVTDAGTRVDKLLGLEMDGKSRNYIHKLIEEEGVSIGGKPVKASRKVKTGEIIEVTIEPAVELELKPVNIPLKIVFENNDLFVIDKPPGLVVHPGQGSVHKEDSLVNALLFHAKGRLSSINGVVRPGIVHRLDKDTSGLLIVAKNDLAHNYLAGLFKNGKIEKEYYALLAGRIPEKSGLIDAPIGRDSRNRKRMAVTARNGRQAQTRFSLVDYYGEYSLVKARLLTGRTHQIRVHFAGIGFPLAGDRLYGKESVNKKLEKETGLKRQFLHAFRLKFSFPGDKKSREFISELPADLELVLEELRR